MGAQVGAVCLFFSSGTIRICLSPFFAMAPMKAMKVMKKGATGKVMTKGGLAEALATDNDLKKSQCAKILDTLAAVATKEVKSAGKFTIPGLFMIKTRLKPARKAGVSMAFGKEIRVKAAPAKTIVKAYCVSALKKSI